MSNRYKDTTEFSIKSSSKQLSTPSQDSQLLPGINAYPYQYDNLLVKIYRRTKRKWYPYLTEKLAQQREKRRRTLVLGKDIEDKDY